MMSTIREALKFFKNEKVIIEGTLFSMMSKVSAMLMITCGVILSAGDWVGAPIKCFSTSGYNIEFLESFCLSEGITHIPKMSVQLILCRLHYGASCGSQLHEKDLDS